MFEYIHSETAQRRRLLCCWWGWWSDRYHNRIIIIISADFKYIYSSFTIATRLIYKTIKLSHEPVLETLKLRPIFSVSRLWMWALRFIWPKPWLRISSVWLPAIPLYKLSTALSDTRRSFELSAIAVIIFIYERASANISEHQPAISEEAASGNRDDGRRNGARQQRR